MAADHVRSRAGKTRCMEIAENDYTANLISQNWVLTRAKGVINCHTLCLLATGIAFTRLTMIQRSF